MQKSPYWFSEINNRVNVYKLKKYYFYITVLLFLTLFHIGFFSPVSVLGSKVTPLRCKIKVEH